MATTTSSPILASRAFQALFSLVVLILSIVLLKGHKESSLPGSLCFAALVGLLSLIAALLSIAAHFRNFLHEQIANVIDGVVLLLSIAGGILMAIKLRGTTCNADKQHWNVREYEKTFTNDILCGGIDKRISDITSCYYVQHGRVDKIEDRCRSAKADSAFMFLTAVTLMAVGVLTYLRMKKGY